MATNLPHFTQFNASDQVSLGPNWERWLNRFENFLVALNITAEGQKKAMLLHYAGEDVYDIYDTYRDDADSYTNVKEKLSTHFKPTKHTQFRVFEFRQTHQLQNETVDIYVTRLRTLAKDCEFHSMETAIIGQITQGCAHSRVRRKSLKPGIELTELLEFARTLETTEKEAALIESAVPASQPVKAITQKPQPKFMAKSQHFKFKPNQVKFKPKPRNSGNSVCGLCGGNYPHTNQCPAQGCLCYSCGRQNHFSRCCRSSRGDSHNYHGSRSTYQPQPQAPSTSGFKYAKRPPHTKFNKEVHHVSEGATAQDSSDNEYVYLVSQTKEQNLPRRTVQLNGHSVDMLIDSGSTVNLLDEVTFKRIGSDMKLTKTPTTLHGYCSSSLPVLGRITTDVIAGNHVVYAPVYVVKGSNGCWLGYDTSVELGFLHIANTVTSNLLENHPIASKFSELFHGLGKMKDVQISLHIDKSINPVAQKHRRIPFHLRQQVEQELDRLESLEIIEKVEGPTPWVSPIVVVPKPKSPTEVRICVDMRQPNKAVKRERHITPTIDDILYDLNGAQVFSKLDLNSGYHQLELDENSRYITTFSTHCGLRRYKRLNFGTHSAAEIFQDAIRGCIQGIPGTINVSDDILVFGPDQASHDRALEAVFKRIKSCGLTLNPNKCVFGKHHLEFFGHIFSSGGISPDPKKVRYQTRKGSAKC